MDDSKLEKKLESIKQYQQTMKRVDKLTKEYNTLKAKLEKKRGELEQAILQAEELQKH